ncbi:MAG: transglycosylase SLT domain-containing protein [Marinisporobacter sp.]|jgi:soluble lytic murein transglycosylase|nr:transglycosylase SLT domain-containing protein [Marinisporobacter sp.]
MKKIIGIVVVVVLILGVVTFINLQNSDDYRLDYEKEIVKYSKEYGVDPFLVATIIRQESGFHNFISWFSDKEDKIGLMQIKGELGEEWAKEMGIEDFSWKDLKDADINIKIGVWYLGKLQKENSDEEIVIKGWRYRGVSKEEIPEGKPGYVDAIEFMKKIYEEKYQEELKID